MHECADVGLGVRHIPSVLELQERARNMRCHVVRMIEKVKVGYLLQGLGAADLFAALYLSEMRLDPKFPNWADRDRLLLSTAHNTAIFYAAFVEAGFLPQEALNSYADDGSPLEVNASERLGAMVEATCGSLGQGLSVGVGMALGLRRRGSSARVYVVLGDGELQEGQVWEAALSAGGFGLENLCMIIDRNYLQVEGHTDRVVAMDPIGKKFESFGWNAIDIDGNNMIEIIDALAAARATSRSPTVIVANTLPGAGVPFLEGQMAHVAFLPSEQAERALRILEAAP